MMLRIMTKRTAYTSLFALAASAAMISCGGGGNDYRGSSRGTGWDITGKDGGFEYNTDYDGQETAPGLAFVEGGTFTMGRVQDDPMHDWNNTPNQQHVQSFYMDETEVTNLMYLEYLDWTKMVYPPEEERFANVYNGVLPDTLVWRNRLGYNETMTDNYLRHPAYANYPVVGVTWIQAVEYSEWRTDRVNEAILEEEGFSTRGARYAATADQNFNTQTYLNTPTNAYGGDSTLTRGGKGSQRRDKDLQRAAQRRAKANPNTDPNATGGTGNSGQNNGSNTGKYVQRKDGVFQPAYRLPTEAEWEFAALGLTGVRDYNAYRGRKKYPWNGSYTRAGSRRSRGDQLANFKQGDGDYGGIAGWSDDGADITAEVKSYSPNDFGLYDMAGNVSEWVADVYRPIVDDEFNDFNYYRGNVYSKNAIGEDGQVKIVTSDSIVFDTLSNGRIVARDLPGEIQQIDVDENETYLRTQFDRADNRDFRDGDKRSSRYYDSADELTEDSGKRMYNSPRHSVVADSVTGGLDRQYDESNDRSTLIDNEVRVIKGGSWRDRAYWLDPAQRRFFPQDMASDDIGFRCAMSRVGSKSKDGKKSPR